jgi:hypothetical protein
MSESHQPVWVRYQKAPEYVSQKLLIAARKAVATEPGTVPEVWPLYTSSNSDSIAAEHAAIGIWGAHQQGQTGFVHAARTEERPYPPNFGAACRKLFDEQFIGDPTISSPLDTMAEDTISKRLAVLSRTDEVSVAVSHITSLVRLMRPTRNSQFDYGDLYWALRNWSDADNRTAVMYRWSRSYFYVAPKKTTTTTTTARAGGK